MIIEGHAHLCFLPPNHEASGAFSEFRGHVISDRSTYGIAGHHLPDHVDPSHNDCMAPEVCYDCVLKDYDTGREVSFLTRRQAGNDAADLFISPAVKAEGDGDNVNTLKFVTERFLVGQQALTHCRKYLKLQDDDDVEGAVVCMGQIYIDVSDKDKWS